MKEHLGESWFDVQKHKFPENKNLAIASAL